MSRPQTLASLTFVKPLTRKYLDKFIPKKPVLDVTIQLINRINIPESIPVHQLELFNIWRQRERKYYRRAVTILHSFIKPKRGQQVPPIIFSPNTSPPIEESDFNPDIPNYSDYESYSDYDMGFPDYQSQNDESDHEFVYQPDIPNESDYESN